MTTTLIDRALDLLDQAGAHDALPEVRAVRARLAELDTADESALEEAATLHERLVAALAESATTVDEAGASLLELKRGHEAHEARRALLPEARARVEQRLEQAARTAGDAWIVALRPAVDQLVEALGRAAKLTDGQLADVAAGGGSPAQRTAVEGVTSALALATLVQDVAEELRRSEIVPTDVLPGPVHLYELAMRWEDVAPVEAEMAARRPTRPQASASATPTERAICLHRDYGAVPALLTAEAVLERASEGARYVAEQGERDRQRRGATAVARKREAEALAAYGLELERV